MFGDDSGLPHSDSFLHKDESSSSASTPRKNAKAIKRFFGKLKNVKIITKRKKAPIFDDESNSSSTIPDVNVLTIENGMEYLILSSGDGSQSARDTEHIESMKKYEESIKHFMKLIVFQNPLDNYTDVSVLYTGASNQSKIMRAVLKPQSSIVVVSDESHQADTTTQSTTTICLKCAPLSNEDKIVELSNEVLIMEQCNHANVIQFNSVCVFEKSVWISMEYCTRGSLTDLISSRGLCLTELQIASICRELLNGLQYLHEQMFIIHRDLKSDNILISDQFEMKISDFGLSVKCSNASEEHSACVGTPFWVAPEMIHHNSKYNFKADMWSLGVVIWEMTHHGEPPHFNVQDSNQVLNTIAFKPAPRLTGDWSPIFKDFMANLLCKTPQQRLSARQALNHEFIQSATQRPNEFLPEIFAELHSVI